MQRFFMIIMNLAFYHPIFSAVSNTWISSCLNELVHNLSFGVQRLATSAYKPAWLGKSLYFLDFPAILETLSACG